MVTPDFVCAESTLIFDLVHAHVCRIFTSFYCYVQVDFRYYVRPE